MVKKTWFVIRLLVVAVNYLFPLIWGIVDNSIHEGHTISIFVGVVLTFAWALTFAQILPLFITPILGIKIWYKTPKYGAEYWVAMWEGKWEEWRKEAIEDANKTISAFDAKYFYWLK